LDSRFLSRFSRGCALSLSARNYQFPRISVDFNLDFYVSIHYNAFMILVMPELSFFSALVVAIAFVWIMKKGLEEQGFFKKKK
jgi:hypothetical protein